MDVGVSGIRVTIRNSFKVLVFSLSFFSYSLSQPAHSPGASADEPAVSPGFRHVTIDAHGPREPHCKAIGDIDGDGLIDVLAGSSSNNTEGLFWYHYPDWTKHNIHAGSFTTDMQVGDIDGDGDLDAIIPKGQFKGESIWWYENPRPTGNPAANSWKEHFVGNAGAHDVEVADLNGDGKLDIVVREESTVIFIQNSPDNWTRHEISARPSEGTALGDIDGDGDIDLVINGIWLENPLPAGNPGTAAWIEHPFANNWPDKVAAHVADINHDGRVDILLAPSESAHGRLAWYETTNPKAGPWIEHVVDSDVSFFHTFKTGDMDKNGTLDIITAEMHQSPSPHRVSVYYNTGGNALHWDKQVISTSGSHNIRVGDIGNDGDLDIVGANWSNAAENGAPIEMWENTSTPTSSRLPLDTWQRHEIDSNRPWRAIFVTAADMDGDGRKDIVTGAWWYKNPGTPGGTWTRKAFGDPLNNMAAVYDFDSNGSMDVLGTEGQSDDPNSMFVWARNDGAGNFTILNNIAKADGTFLQGVAIARFNPGASLGIALSWHDSKFGTQMLTVPADPSSSTWAWSSISSASQNEQLSAGDIDNDGDSDLLMGTQWLQNNPSAWAPRTLNGIALDVDRSRLADINKDGRLDAVVGFETSALPGRLAWYEQPSDSATGSWVEHLITTDIIGAMSVDVGDIDNDGDLDVVAGEHNLANPSAARLFVFENSDGKGLTWIPHLVSTGDEHHDGAQLADIDNDGDLDIVSIGWTHGKVLLYENLAINGRFEIPPSITRQPANEGILPGHAATFSVQAAGQESLSYQWKMNGTDIPGANRNTYTTNPVTLADNRSTYTCVVSNAGGSIASRDARLLVSPSTERTNQGLIVWYAFHEGAGATVSDISGTGEPLNLTIGDPTAVTWSTTGLTVNRSALIATPLPATKIFNAVHRSHEFTIEAWVRPQHLEQNGPARIITMSYDHSTRNFTIGQGLEGGPSDVVNVRQRTTGTTLNGLPSLTSPSGSLDTGYTHILVTHRRDGTLQTWINGVVEASGMVSGDLSNWDSTFQFGLANEFTGDRPWLGEYSLVAMYDRALTEDEITRNFVSGRQTIVTGISPAPEAGHSQALSYVLYQNSPNPFNPSTVIRYDLPRDSHVEVTVYDLLGRKVATLVEETQHSGRHEVRFDAARLSSGVYFCRMKAGAFSASTKLLLVR